MENYSEQDFRNWGENQGFMWDEGAELDALVHFHHEGLNIVNPYSHTQGDPAEIFGSEKMDAWQNESAAMFDEFAADQ